MTSNGSRFLKNSLKRTNEGFEDVGKRDQGIEEKKGWTYPGKEYNYVFLTESCNRADTGYASMHEVVQRAPIEEQKGEIFNGSISFL